MNEQSFLSDTLFLHSMVLDLENRILARKENSELMWKNEKEEGVTLGMEIVLNEIRNRIGV